MSRLTIVLAHLDDSTTNRSVLELIGWTARTRPDVELLVLANRAGDREHDFAGLAPVYVVNEIRPHRRPSAALQTARLHRPAELVRAAELRRVVRRGTDGVWLADLRAAHLLEWIGPARVVAHLHAEDPPPTPDAATRSLVRLRASTWTAGNALAARRLADAFGIATDQVEERSDFAPSIRLAAAAPPPIRADRRARTRSELADRFGIPATAPLVLGGGAIDFWRAADAFAQLAGEVVRARPGAGPHLAWDSGHATDRMLWPLRHDLDHLAIAERVHVIRGGIAPAELRLAADVLVWTGREPIDPVDAVELALIGTPIVAFAGPVVPTGLSDRTTVVPFPSVSDLRAAVLTLLDDPAARAAVGEPSPGSSTTWDVRVGGPVLLADVLGPGPAS